MKLAENFLPTNSSRFRICEYSISKIKLFLLPTVYSSYINCLAAIADLSIFTPWKEPTAAASWKRTKWKGATSVLLRLVSELRSPLRAHTTKWNLNGYIKKNANHLRSEALCFSCLNKKRLFVMAYSLIDVKILSAQFLGTESLTSDALMHWRNIWVVGKSVRKMHIALIKIHGKRVAYVAYPFNDSIMTQLWFSLVFQFISERLKLYKKRNVKSRTREYNPKSFWVCSASSMRLQALSIFNLFFRTFGQYLSLFFWYLAAFLRLFAKYILYARMHDKGNGNVTSIQKLSYDYGKHLLTYILHWLRKKKSIQR